VRSAVRVSRWYSCSCSRVRHRGRDRCPLPLAPTFLYCILRSRHSTVSDLLADDLRKSRCHIVLYGSYVTKGHNALRSSDDGIGSTYSPRTTVYISPLIMTNLSPKMKSCRKDRVQSDYHSTFNAADDPICTRTSQRIIPAHWLPPLGPIYSLSGPMYGRCTDGECGS